MKKIILLIMAVVYGELAFAAGYSYENNWRWKKDEGTATSIAWKAPMNTSTVISNDEPVRLRQMVIINTASWNLEGALTLEYSDEAQTNTSVGKWKRVPLKSEAEAETAAFIIEDDYVGTGTSAGYVNGRFLAGDMQIADRSRSQAGGDYGTHQGGGIFATTNTAGIGQGAGATGEWEVEHRIKPTHNAIAGTVYYFRLNTANGAPDTEDYDAGYPSIAISKDYRGAPNVDLPDLSAAILSGGGSYTTGVSRPGILRIENVGPIATVGPISAKISIPTNFVFAIPTLPAGWSYSGGVLSTSTVSLAPTEFQDFNYTLSNNTAGFAANFLRIAIDKTITLDSDGSNNAISTVVYKQQ